MNRISFPLAMLAPAALMFVLLLQSCGGTGSNTQVVATQANDLPPFPREQPVAVPPRNSSLDRDSEYVGTDYFQTNAAVNGDTTLHLNPAEPDVGPVAWAIYRFEGIGPGLVATTFSATFSDMVPDEEYFFAFADFTSNAWEVNSFTASAASEEVSLLGEFSAADHVSPGGNIYVALMTHDILLTVVALQLTGTHGLAAPQNMYATDLLSPHYTIVWADLVPGATGYEVFYKEQGQPDDFYGFLGNAGENEGKVFFEHQDNAPPGKPAEFGVPYEYKVRATADGEDPSPFSIPDIGIRGYEAPTRLIASDQAYEDEVLLLWFADTNNKEAEYSYGIIRDDAMIDIVTTTGEGGGSYVDNTVGDFAEHVYEVRRGSMELGFSDPSPTDTGCRASWSNTLLFSGDLGDDFFADMEVAPSDPTIPAVAAYHELGNSIYFGHGGMSTFFQVVDAQCGRTMELTIHDGRPWIAFDNNNAAHGPEGLRIARGKIADPSDPEHWDVYTILEGTIDGEEIAMEVINGRLAVLFSEQIGEEEFNLYYGVAMVNDPILAEDWDLSKIGTFANSVRPYYFDLAEREGIPVVAVQNVIGGMRMYVADDGSPSSPDDWSDYIVPNGAPVSGPCGIDLVIHDGLAFIPFIESNIEGPGRARLMYTTVWPPEQISDWWPSDITTFSAQEAKGIKLAFINKRPWLSWSHTGDDGPVVASHVYDEDYNDGGWHGGLWLIEPLDVNDVFIGSYNETTLLAIDGRPALTYVGRHNISGGGYHLRFAQIDPKP